MIAGIPLTENDFKTAVDLLKSRLLIAISLLHTSQDQIEAIGVDKNSFSSIVVPILIEKVPEAIRYNVAHFEDKCRLEWTLDEGEFEQSVLWNFHKNTLSHYSIHHAC